MKSLQYVSSRRTNLDIRSNFLQQLSNFEAFDITPKTGKWSELSFQVSDKLYKEEELLRNTFLNSQLGPVSNILIRKENKNSSKIKWIDENNETNIKSDIPEINENYRIRPYKYFNIPSILKTSKRPSTAAQIKSNRNAPMINSFISNTSYDVPQINEILDTNKGKIENKSTANFSKFLHSENNKIKSEIYKGKDKDKEKDKKKEIKKDEQPIQPIKNVAKAPNPKIPVVIEKSTINTNQNTSSNSNPKNIIPPDKSEDKNTKIDEIAKRQIVEEIGKLNKNIKEKTSVTNIINNNITNVYINPELKEQAIKEENEKEQVKVAGNF